MLFYGCVCGAPNKTQTKLRIPLYKAIKSKNRVYNSFVFGGETVGDGLARLLADWFAYATVSSLAARSYSTCQNVKRVR